MEIGVCVASSATAWKTVEEAEKLGFHSAWFWDSPLVCGDPFAAMAVAASKTSKIRLGTGVYVPANRDPSVTASGFATLNALAPGRIELNAGTGFSGRRCYGLPPMTMKVFREHMTQAAALLAGETVTVTYGKRTKDIRLLHADRDLINIDDPIRYHIAAGGPKMRELTAELGMNWCNVQGPFGTVEGSAGDMDRAWAAAGRPKDQLRKTIFTSGCLLRDGEDYDSPRVREVIGGNAAGALHYWLDAEQLMGQDVDHLLPTAECRNALAQYRELYKEYPEGQQHMYVHEGHCLFIREDEEHIITGDLIDQLTLSGDAATMREKLKQFEEAGIDELVVSITHGQDECLEDWARYFNL